MGLSKVRKKRKWNNVVARGRAVVAAALRAPNTGERGAVEEQALMAGDYRSIGL